MSRKLAFLLAALLAAPLAAQYQMTLPLPGGGAAADPLTVLGPASVCDDNQLARWNGASNTALQCSALTVADTTGDITAPGALTIAAGGTDQNVTISPTGTGRTVLNGYFQATGWRSPNNAQTVTFDDNANMSGVATYAAVAGFEGPLSLCRIGAEEFLCASGVSFVWTSGGWNTGRDTRLLRDGAGIMAQQYLTQAQTYRLYGTYTDASNYERLSFSTQAGTSGTIAMETAGTGADNLDLILKPAGTGQFYIGAGGTTAAAPASVVVNATGGSGTDIAGASLTLAGGKGTGNAAGGSVVIQTSDPGSTGTTLQTLATRVTVGVARTNIANILSLTGIAAAPGTPAAGDIVYDAVNNLFCGYNGSAWVSFSGAGTCWAE